MVPSTPSSGPTSPTPALLHRGPRGPSLWFSVFAVLQNERDTVGVLKRNSTLKTTWSGCPKTNSDPGTQRRIIHSWHPKHHSLYLDHLVFSCFGLRLRPRCFLSSPRRRGPSRPPRGPSTPTGELIDRRSSCHKGEPGRPVGNHDGAFGLQN